MNTAKQPGETPLPEAPAATPPAPGAKRWHVGTLHYTLAGLIVLFCWLLWGDFAWSLKERSAMPMVQLLLKSFSASNFFVAILLGSVPGLCALLVQPYFSVKSDRHRGRFGRRIPFLAWSTPVAVAGMFGLGLSAEFAAKAHTLIGIESLDQRTVALGVVAVSWTLFEAGTLVGNAIFLALINDIVPERLLGRFFGLFRIVSLGTGIGFNYWVLPHAERNHTAIFLGIGLIYGVSFMFMCLRVKEGDYPPPPPPSAGNTGGRAVGSIVMTGVKFVRECFINPYYLAIYLGYNLCAVSFSPANVYSVFYAKSLGLDMGTYGKIIATTYGISLTLSYFIGMMADRFHPLRVGIVAALLYTVIVTVGGLLISGAGTFSIFYGAHVVLSGVFFTATSSLCQRLFPKERFAQFYSAVMLVHSLALIIVTTGVGKWLDAANSRYALTFWIGGAMSALGAAILLWVDARRRRYCISGCYVAPE